jgi:hypothetical protein
MNWKWKAFLQMVLSVIPGGEHGNYLFQKYITRTLPTSDTGFADHVRYAQQHIAAINRYYQGPVTQATFYEFGAGWDLIIPLSFYALGVERQILVDIRSLLKPSLVNDSIDKFQTVANLNGLSRRPNTYLNGRKNAISTQLRNFYGIDYRAPCDPKQTRVKSSTIDCITSTSTLEHIPLPELRPILRECHRLLRSGGVMSFVIDYADHYSYFDSRLSAYNYLQYSDKTWSLYSPSLHYQNRLRHRDYLDLLRETGFEILEQQRYGGDAVALKSIQALSVDQQFGKYTLEELAVGSALIVARRPV